MCKGLKSLKLLQQGGEGIEPGNPNCDSVPKFGATGDDLHPSPLGCVFLIVTLNYLPSLLTFASELT